MTKVCHLTSAHNSDDIRIFHKECRSLAKAGFDTYLIAPDATDGIIDGVKVFGVPKLQGRYNRMTKTVNSVYIKALEIDADIFHFHDPELIRVGLQLKKDGKKVIYDTHEDLPRQIEDKHYIKPIFRKAIARSVEIYENYAAKKLDRIIAATPHIAERFKKLNPNTIDINNYPLQDELATQAPWQLKEKAICFVGGITRIRGLKEVVKAMEYVEDTILHLAGQISGDDLEQELSSMKGWEKVKYHGHVSRQQVKEILSISKAGIITLLPAANHIFAQPNKMFEYMSAGIPVIGSGFPLWEQILIGNKCGLTVDPEDPKSIAGAINEIMADDDLAQQMGNNGREAVLSKYNWEQEEQKLIELYKLLE